MNDAQENTPIYFDNRYSGVIINVGKEGVLHIYAGGREIDFSNWQPPTIPEDIKSGLKSVAEGVDVVSGKKVTSEALERVEKAFDLSMKGTVMGLKAWDPDDHLGAVIKDIPASELKYHGESLQISDIGDYTLYWTITEVK